MSEGVIITSVQNPKIKEAVGLRDRRSRDRSQKFLIEGYREVFRAEKAGWAIDTLFVCSELFLGENERDLIRRCAAKAKVHPCSEQVFRKLSYRDRPDGLLAVAPQRKNGLDDMPQILGNTQDPFLVVAESIEKPGNLGTILRSSDAVALDAVLVCDRCTDIFNPNVVRASVGTLFTVPVAETEGEETLRWLKERGIRIVASTPSADTVFTEVDLTGSIAIAVGTEQLGLSKKWMEHADVLVKIPMHGEADSLNVAMAATLLLYEAFRQRRNG